MYARDSCGVNITEDLLHCTGLEQSHSANERDTEDILEAVHFAGHTFSYPRANGSAPTIQGASERSLLLSPLQLGTNSVHGWVA